MIGRVRPIIIGLMLVQLLLQACGKVAPNSRTAEKDSDKASPVVDPSFFKAVSVTLDDAEAPFPAGPGREAVASNCLACHSADMILNQPKLSRQDWAGEVGKMQTTYKAPISDTDVPAIVAYLTSLKPAA